MEVNKVVKCDSNYSKCGQLDPFATQSEEEKSNCTKFLRKKQQRSYNVVKESLRRNMESGLNNGRWTLEEHKRFIQGVLEFGNRWRYVAKVIETRNSAQIRSHCQKFFSKLHNLGIEGISNNITDVNYLHDLALTLEPNDLSQLIIQLTDVAFNKLEKLDNKKQDQKKDPIILKIEVQESENKERESRLETEKRFTENFSLGRTNLQEEESISARNNNFKVISKKENLEKQLNKIRSYCEEDAYKKKEQLKTTPNVHSCHLQETKPQSKTHRKIETVQSHIYDTVSEEYLHHPNEYTYDMLNFTMIDKENMCKDNKLPEQVTDTNLNEIDNMFRIFDKEEENKNNKNENKVDIISIANKLEDKKVDLVYEMMKSKLSQYSKEKCELSSLQNNVRNIVESDEEMKKIFTNYTDEVCLNYFLRDDNI